jgi:hypothetical protein
VPSHPDRLEREINEILEHVAHPLPPTPGRSGKVEQAWRPFADAISSWERARVRSLSHVPFVRLMLLSFVMLLAGVILDDVLPYEGYWLSIAGCLLFIPSFAFVVFGTHRQPRARQPRDGEQK